MSKDHGGNITEIARIYGINEKKMIDFSASINPLGYPSGLKKLIMEDFDSILQYPDIDSFDLVSALSEYHDIHRENILVGNGSTEFMYLIPQVTRPQKALIVTPAFSEYEKGLALSGARVSHFQTGEKINFFIDTDSLCFQMQKGFDILYLCNPANPTGALTKKYNLYKIIESAHQSDTLIIIDEAFIDFVEEESVKKEINTYPNLVVLRSMTKFFGIPGLRLGYTLAHKSFIKKMRKHQIPWTVNSLAQKVSVGMLKNRAYIIETRRYIAAEREVFAAALNQIPGLKVYAGSVNFLLICLDESLGINVTQLRDTLIADGIIIRDCSNFNGLNDRFFRIAVKRRKYNMKLVEKLKEIFSTLN